MTSNQRETFQGRELSDDELEVLRQQVESFDSIDEIDPEIRDIIARRWPELLIKLAANKP
jgi:hypothetical protein